MVAWAFTFPKRFRRSSSSRRGTSQVTYVTMVPRGNETLRRMPYFLHPCERLASTSQKLTLLVFGWAFKLSGLYVTPPVTFRHSVGLITYMFQSVGTQGRSPKRFRRSVSFPRGTMVTYVTWDVIHVLIKAGKC